MKKDIDASLSRIQKIRTSIVGLSPAVLSSDKLYAHKHDRIYYNILRTYI